MNRFESIDTYRERLFLGIERARHSAKGRLQDIARAVALMPDRATELGRLRGVVAGSLAQAELTAQLVDPSIARRTSALLRLVWSGAYRDDLLQHAALAFVPERYLRYKRRALRRLEAGGA